MSVSLADQLEDLPRMADYYRRKRGLSWQDVADEMEINRSTMTNLRRRENVKYETVLSAARWVDVQREAFANARRWIALR